MLSIPFKREVSSIDIVLGIMQEALYIKHGFSRKSITLTLDEDEDRFHKIQGALASKDPELHQLIIAWFLIRKKMINATGGSAEAQKYLLEAYNVRTEINKSIYT